MTFFSFLGAAATFARVAGRLQYCRGLGHIGIRGYTNNGGSVAKESGT